MRPLEIFSIISIGVTVYLLLFKKKENIFLSSLFFSIILTILQYFLEGARWQFNFAIFLLPVIYFRFKILNFSRNLLFDVFISLWFLLALLIPILIPVFNLPQPEGDYNVGTETFHWIDSSRTEWFTVEDSTDFRNLVIQTWYPGIPTEKLKQELYLDNIDLRSTTMASAGNIPSFFPRHLKYVYGNSYKNIETATLPKKLPILIFSHGITSSRSLHQSLFESLSSRGYVIFALNHSYDANLTIFPNNMIADYRSELGGNPDSLNLRKKQMKTRALDIVFLLDQIKKIQSNKIESRLNNLLNTDKIGIAGHSYGGATAILASRIDKRIKSCLVLDGWLSPLPDSVINSGLDIPLFFAGRTSWEDSDYPDNYSNLKKIISHSSKAKYNTYIKNSLHLDYTDIPLFSPIIRYVMDVGDNPPETSISLVNDLTFLFLEQHLLKKENINLDKFLKKDLFILN